MITALALLIAQSAAPAPAPIPPLDTARETIAAQDGALFWAAFEGCDGEKVRRYVTDDFRMIHDLGGLVVEGGDAFAGQIAQSCNDREEGGPQEGYLNRRLLVPGTRQVTPLGDWGVLERGWHTFHERRMRPAGTYDANDPGGPTWVQVGGARYIHVWRWMSEEGRFRLAESISVDHGAAPAYPPQPSTSGG
ncbi:hypothetical protein NAP1_14543 [Erythrobacter sp. NAP1]|uniref:DUF4440 domain-containing protein n=1 Tax=Erythrobacter sp. NAP1 TaxID=237727 RepID=UPI0000687956|nr:DUF4440 domain-containing protein [Erythrobacter sp. NAP1]EAQ28826.1 hypothetical protein NAP1_14543 [Erythrobacter sp. NAP1]